jgi:hypothetical protein
MSRTENRRSLNRSIAQLLINEAEQLGPYSKASQGKIDESFNFA